MIGRRKNLTGQQWQLISQWLRLRIQLRQLTPRNDSKYGIWSKLWNKIRFDKQEGIRTSKVAREKSIDGRKRTGLWIDAKWHLKITIISCNEGGGSECIIVKQRMQRKDTIHGNQKTQRKSHRRKGKQSCHKKCTMWLVLRYISFQETQLWCPLPNNAMIFQKKYHNCLWSLLPIVNFILLLLA